MLINADSRLVAPYVPSAVPGQNVHVGGGCLVTCIVLSPDVGFGLKVGGRKVTPDPFPDEPLALFQFVRADFMASLSSGEKFGSMLTCTSAPCAHAALFGSDMFGKDGT
jgi:hypothetical protein